LPCETLDECPGEAQFCDLVDRTADFCCGRPEADCVRLSQRRCQTCQVDGTTQSSGSGSAAWRPEDGFSTDVSFRLSPAGVAGAVPVTLGTGSGCVSANGTVAQTTTFSLTGTCSDDTRSTYVSDSTETTQRFTACIANFGALERATTGTLADDTLTASFARESSTPTSAVSVSLSIEIRPAE
jgi:hypothetical protein